MYFIFPSKNYLLIFLYNSFTPSTNLMYQSLCHSFVKSLLYSILPLLHSVIYVSRHTIFSVFFTTWLKPPRQFLENNRSRWPPTHLRPRLHQLDFICHCLVNPLLEIKRPLQRNQFNNWGFLGDWHFPPA